MTPTNNILLYNDIQTIQVRKDHKYNCFPKTFNKD